MSPSECADVLAGHFGIAPSDDSFVVERAGRRLRVTVASNSGCVTGVVITAFGAPLPAVRLTRESSFDRLGKRLRIAREAQLGDATFDAKVYIDTSLSDAQTQWLFVSTAARAAVLALFASCTEIALTERGIVTTTMNEGLFTADARALTSHLETMLALYDALPRAAAALREGQRVRRGALDFPYHVEVWYGPGASAR